jgi:hypothetical protein
MARAVGVANCALHRHAANYDTKVFTTGAVTNGGADLSVTWDDVLWAAVTVGPSNGQDVYLRGLVTLKREGCQVGKKRVRKLPPEGCAFAHHAYFVGAAGGSHPAATPRPFRKPRRMVPAAIAAATLRS